MKTINKIDNVLSYIKGCMSQDEFSTEKLKTDLNEILDAYDSDDILIFKKLKYQLDQIVVYMGFSNNDASLMFEDIEDVYDRDTEEKLYLDKISTIQPIIELYLKQLVNCLKGNDRMKLEPVTELEDQTQLIEDMNKEDKKYIFEKYLYLYLSAKYQKSNEHSSLLTVRHLPYLEFLFGCTRKVIEKQRSVINILINKKQHKDFTKYHKRQYVTRVNKLIDRVSKDNSGYHDLWQNQILDELAEIKQFLVSE
ncbi:hypothetical protein N8364_01055 [Saprospiraceae bacterium]|nr:hypothetical protein [Saprospiraceae bacterium]